MLNKKAETEMSIRTIFILGIVVIIAAVLFTNTYKITTSDIYVLKNSVIDLSLEIDAILSLPIDSNAFVVFPFPFETDVVIGDNKVKLSKGKLHSEYFYTGDSEIKTQLNKFSKIKNLYLIRDGKSLTFSDKGVDIKNLYSCPDINLNLNTITIDPGKGYDSVNDKGDFGKLINGRYESLFNLDIASLIKAYGDVFVITKTFGTNFEDSFLSIEDRKSKVKDALISIHAGNVENLIKAYVNPDKDSVALACKLLNEFKKNLKINTAIIPVNFKLIPVDDYKQILNLDKPAVLLEIGSEKDKLITKKQIIAESIIDGVKNV